MKNLIINVDDLGFSSAINQAVLNLAEKQRIHATSFMSLGEITQSEVQILDYLNIEIGLHLDLTGLAKVGSLKQVLLKSYLRLLPQRELENLINQQLDEFENKITKAPTFIDGHQHVHQFPTVRKALLACLEKRYTDSIPIRNTDTYQKDSKAKLIHFLGGQALKHELITKKWPHNDYFAGIYNFNATETQLYHLWDDWLKNAPNNTVIMCHPSLENQNWADDIHQARILEYKWLMSDNFMSLWKKYNCHAQTWKDYK